MTDRGTARLVGVLFIVACRASLNPTTSGRREGLSRCGRHDTRVATGAVCKIVVDVAIVAIAVILYPVLKRARQVLPWIRDKRPYLLPSPMTSNGMANRQAEAEF